MKKRAWWLLGVVAMAGMASVVMAQKSEYPVIVIPTDPEKRLGGFESWWDVPVAATSGQASVREARAVYDEKHAARRPDLR